MPKFQRIYWSKKFDWKHYSGLYDRYCKSKNNYYFNSVSAMLKPARLTNSSRVCDLACGTGALTRQLLKEHPKIKIFAIDLSEEMLAYYRKNFSKQIRKGQISVVCGNAEKINEYTNQKYDVVFIASALWDMEIGSLFKSISRILRKNGTAIFNLPALVVEKEKGFVFFIEHFFRQTLNSKAIYRRIKISRLKKLASKHGLQMVKTKEYSFITPKQNVAKFFDLLRYRYPFILFPKEMPYNQKLKRCTEIFNESLKYIPKDGIEEDGFVFVLKKK